MTFWTATFRVSVSQSSDDGCFIVVQSLENAAKESNVELCVFSKDPGWLAKIMQNINFLYLRYSTLHSHCTLTLHTDAEHTLHSCCIRSHVYSSYTCCTHVMSRTLHLRNVAQVHSWCAGAVMLYTCTLCCTAALVLHRCIHVAYVYSCSTGAIMLHRCIHVAQVYSCCTGATILQWGSHTHTQSQWRVWQERCGVANAALWCSKRHTHIHLHIHSLSHAHTHTHIHAQS